MRLQLANALAPRIAPAPRCTGSGGELLSASSRGMRHWCRGRIEMFCEGSRNRAAVMLAGFPPPLREFGDGRGAYRRAGMHGRRRIEP
jgi:hypothetical protein